MTCDSPVTLQGQVARGAKPGAFMSPGLSSSIATPPATDHKVSEEEIHLATAWETLQWYAKRGAAKIGIKSD